MLAYILGRRIPATYAVVVTLAAILLSAQHFLARPHVLVLPVMLSWAYGLMSASERGEAPSFWLLPLIALWANLHGEFVFGLVLVGAFALDALWNADHLQQRPPLLRWIVFGVGALAACCFTPYGWGSILASGKILGLGELLRLIYEWMPADFSSLGAFDFDPRLDRGCALRRRQAVGAADRTGAGPAAYGALPCPQSRDICAADTARHNGAGGGAVRFSPLVSRMDMPAASVAVLAVLVAG